jgi:hypothetical protein
MNVMETHRDRTSYTLRDLEEARRFLLQGLWWQRVAPPTAGTIRPALEWAMEAANEGTPLPPLGFIADLGQAAFGSDWETRSSRSQVSIPGLPVNLLSTYEDHVLGKIYADWTFARASDALRRYEGRDRARGLAFLLRHVCDRAGIPGVEFSPGIIKAALDSPPEEVLNQGWESLRQDGPQQLLIDMYETLIQCARRTAEVLGPEDIFELEHRTALAEYGERLALRQVLQAAAAFEATLPRHKLRVPPRRMEVPTRILDEDTYPVGGFTSISNRGSIESLLHSQLAYMEPDPNERPDLFDIKFLRDELLYYARDENQFLRRRRTFAIVLDPTLAEEIHFKDSELPFQRGILLLGMLVTVVRKLTEWLSTDALAFRFLFVGGGGDDQLEHERELLAMLLRESIANGTVFLERLPAKGVAPQCTDWARRSLCHVLNVSPRPKPLEAADTAETLLQIAGPRPALGEERSDIQTPETDDAQEAWNVTLQRILQRWL